MSACSVLQGFLVALFYCFLNSEVQNTVRHHMESWQTERTLGGDRRYNYSKDWSPRSRTESIRFVLLEHQEQQRYLTFSVFFLVLLSAKHDLKAEHIGVKVLTRSMMRWCLVGLWHLSNHQI